MTHWKTAISKVQAKNNVTSIVSDTEAVLIGVYYNGTYAVLKHGTFVADGVDENGVNQALQEHSIVDKGWH